MLRQFLTVFLLVALIAIGGTSRAQSVEVAYSIIPRSEMQFAVAQQLSRAMKANGLDHTIAKARLSWAVGAVSDKVADRLSKEVIPLKIARGDSMLLKQQLTPAKKNYWKSWLDEAIATTISTWTGPYLIENDQSDRILIFHSDIEVLADGEMKVAENITIYNGNGSDATNKNGRTIYNYNDYIQRGIYRDIPVIYEDSTGFWSNVGFKLDDVLLDGQKTVFVSSKLGFGQKILIGDKEQMLSTGIHQYTIKYSIKKQLLFHDDKTELYWNVNGNGWGFIADSISCTVSFPEGAKIFESACYTGFSGSTASQCNARLLSENKIHFASSVRFENYEGLTIAAAIQNGIITKYSPPNLLQKAKDNSGFSLLVLLLLFNLVYNIGIWLWRGRDPRKGVIFPQFSPPAGISAADAGYVHQQKFSSELFAAALVDMAVHKQLLIEVEEIRFILKKTIYRFKKHPERNGSHTGFKHYYGFEPSDLEDEIAEAGTYNPTLKSCYDKLSKKLSSKHLADGQYKRTGIGHFFANSLWLLISTIIFLASVALGLYLAFTYMSPFVGKVIGVILFIHLIVYVLFARIIKAYTQKGRRLADEIEGFKMYLESAEKLPFDQMTPPHKTLELFEKYLPYAIALGVENKWAYQFEDLLQKAIAEGYEMSYYRSSNFGSNFNISGMSQSLSSGLSGTLTSASTPPSSSGGSSGGGSSGGGGGGGGGGGW